VPLTIKQYLEALVQARLVEAPRLTEVVRSYHAALKADPGQGPPTLDGLGEALIQAELITPWQHERLASGRGTAFHLGPYRLLDLLGRDSGGKIYLAEHTKIKRLEALQVLPESMAKDPVRQELFFKLCGDMGNLNNPHLVEIYNVEKCGDVYYRTMKFIEGWDLARLVKEHGPLDFQAAADYIQQTAEGLAYAHEQGVLHRGLTPARLMVDAEGHVRILGLGMAILEGDSEHYLSRIRNQVSGLVDYWAPELVTDSEHVDARTDLYSLGGILYFLLTGEPPFPTGTVAQRLLHHQHHAPPEVAQKRADVPPALAELCTQLLAKNPADRPASARAVAQRLSHWLEVSSVNEAVAAPSSIPAADSASSSKSVNSLPSGTASNSSTNHTSSNSQSAAASSVSSRSLSRPAAAPATRGRSTLVLVALVGLTAAVALALGGWYYVQQSVAVAPVKEEVPVKPVRRSFVDKDLVWKPQVVAPTAARYPGPFLRLFEDEPDIVTRLHKDRGELSLDTTDPYRGLASLKVTGNRVQQGGLINGGVWIKENPSPGEFRYLRFAWKRSPGKNLLLELSINNSWGATRDLKAAAYRYEAGPELNRLNAAATKLSDNIPTEWTEVTRDLFRDFGEFNLTGLAFSPQEGEAHLDHVYLGRSGNDLNLASSLQIDPQAALVVDCGRASGEMVRRAPGYDIKKVKANNAAAWPDTMAFQSCWNFDRELLFEVRVPPCVPGRLRLCFVDSRQNRKQKVFVNGREIGEIQDFSDGKCLEKSYSSEQTASGVLDVKLQQTGDTNCVISRVQFLPAWQPVKLPANIELVDDVVYRKTPEGELKLDIFRPKSRPAALPAVLFLPEIWKYGSRKQMHSLAAELASKGFVTFCVDYRGRTKSKFADSLEDVHSALQWVVREAKQQSVDPQRLGLFGCGPGAYLASLVALADPAQIESKDASTNPPEPRVLAVAGLGGFFDLTEALKHEKLGPVLTEFLGKEIVDDPERLRRATPLTWVTKESPAFCIMQARQDPFYPYNQLDLARRKFGDVRAPLEVFATPNQRANFVDITSRPLDYYTRVVDRMNSFFTSKLQATPSTPVASQSGT